jgi:hypothetical protein
MIILITATRSLLEETEQASQGTRILRMSMFTPKTIGQKIINNIMVINKEAIMSALMATKC